MNIDIEKSFEVLRLGGTIIYPTDTIWGIGGDATNVEAIQNVSKIKGKRGDKNYILLVNSTRMLAEYVDEIPPIAYELMEVADKPLTIVYPNASHLPQQLIAPDGSIAIRITRDIFCSRLIDKLRKPIVSTSANRTGEPFPANFSEISDDILQMVDYVVTWRQNEAHLAMPSSIIKIGLSGEVKIIRK